MHETGVGITDTGRVRDHNEDFIQVSNGPIGDLPNLYIVSDGIGGHQAGEVASQKCVEFFCQYIKDNARGADEQDPNMLETMAAAVYYANARIFAMSLKDESLRGMGATFSACAVANDQILVVHVGDSRIYWADAAALRQLTIDHTLVQSMVDAGEITKAEAADHPQRNIIMRAVGTDEFVLADHFAVPVTRPGTLLLCSDGLTDMLRDEQIHSILSDAGAVSDKARQLVQNANDQGGADNISVVLVPVRREDEPEVAL